MSRKHFTRATLLAALLLCLSMGISMAAPGGNPNRGVAPPQANAHGSTYGELAQAWWTWAVSFPAAENPMIVDTNDALQQDQTEKVFFLTGSQVPGPHVRDVTVPPGTPLFFPVINALWWAPDDLPLAATIATGVGLDPTMMTDEELLRFVAAYSIGAYNDDVTVEMSVVVDGKELADLTAYRAVSPEVFPIEDTDFFGPLPGRMYVADGYWILLNPLSKGEHTIQITGEITGGPFGGFVLDVTYNLTVGK